MTACSRIERRRGAGTTIAACLFACLVFPPTAGATDLYFRDFTAYSPNGGFRLEASSPDHAGGALVKPFAKNFVYRMYRGNTRQLIWEARDLTDSPTEARVRNDGWLVIHSHWTGLTFVNPRGKKTGEQSMVYAYLPPEDIERYVQKTTAGPVWEGYSRWFFANAGGRPCYCLRTWWKRRVVFDLETGRRVADEGEVKEALDTAERATLLRSLAEAAKQVRGAAAEGQNEVKVHAWPSRKAHDVAADAYMAGLLGCTRAEADLRTLERVSNWGYGQSDGREAAPGQVKAFDYWQFTVRSMAQLSLRRLGQHPSDRPATLLYAPKQPSQERAYYKPVAHTQPRVARVNRVDMNMTTLEVLNTLGPPDHIDDVRDTWAYDIDAETPITLHLHWSEQYTVGQLERVSPPAWQTGGERDESLNR